jgi:hypothetical protein
VVNMTENNTENPTIHNGGKLPLNTPGFCVVNPQTASLGSFIHCLRQFNNRLESLYGKGLEEMFVSKDMFDKLQYECVEHCFYTNPCGKGIGFEPVILMVDGVKITVKK